MAEDGSGGERIGHEFEPVPEQVWQTIIGGYEQAWAAWRECVEPMHALIMDAKDATAKYLATQDLPPLRLDGANHTCRDYQIGYQHYVEWLGALEFELMLRRAEHQKFVAIHQQRVDALLGGKMLWARGSEQHGGFVLADGQNQIVGAVRGSVFGLYGGVDLSCGAVRLKFPEGNRADYAHVQLFSTDGSRFRLCELFARS